MELKTLYLNLDSVLKFFGELIVLFELRLSQGTQGTAFTFYYKNTKQ